MNLAATQHNRRHHSYSRNRCGLVSLAAGLALSLPFSLSLSVLASLSIQANAGGTTAPEWPQWRGPQGQGHAPGTGYPLRWSETEGVTWKTPVPGRGWSSPVIEGNSIWMTTGIETPAPPEDTQRRLKGNTGDQPLTLLSKVELRAIEIDRATGKPGRNVLLLSESDPQWVHELNTYASPSPVIEAGRLYCHFGTFGTTCLDTKSGTVLWKNTDLHIMHENGPGSSPVLWNDLLIFHMDGSDKQYIAALDKNTGKLVWKTDRSGEMDPGPQLKKSYGTPLVVGIEGKDQLLSPASNWLYSYDEQGKELWKVSYGALGFSLTPKPVVGHGMVFLSTGFMRPQILAIRFDGTNAAAPSIAWKNNRGGPTMPSLLLVGDELYFQTDAGGMLTCVDAVSGKEHYRERLGGNFSSSPTFANGRIYFSNREGLTTVVRPGKTFDVLATNKVDGKILASLAAADRAFFLRTDTALYRIESAPQIVR